MGSVLSSEIADGKQVNPGDTGYTLHKDGVCCETLDDLRQENLALREKTEVLQARALAGSTPTPNPTSNHKTEKQGACTMALGIGMTALPAMFLSFSSGGSKDSASSCPEPNTYVPPGPITCPEPTTPCTPEPTLNTISSPTPNPTSMAAPSWRLVLQYGASAYSPTASASGVVSDDNTGFAKLSDAEINAIVDNDPIFDYYMLTSDGPPNESLFFLRTMNEYVDTNNAMNLASGMLSWMCSESSIESCTWVDRQIGSTTGINLSYNGDDCNRWFTFNVECYNGGSIQYGVRCWASGSTTCGFATRQNVKLYKLSA